MGRGSTGTGLSGVTRAPGSPCPRGVRTGTGPSPCPRDRTTRTTGAGSLKHTSRYGTRARGHTFTTHSYYMGYFFFFLIFWFWFWFCRESLCGGS